MAFIKARAYLLSVIAMEQLDFTIPVVHKATVQSPVSLSRQQGDCLANYVQDDECVRHDIETSADATHPGLERKELLEKAGPREEIYFDPATVHAAIVTCGGLCPGLNNVIRAIVMCLWYHYGVRRISGVRYGYR